VVRSACATSDAAFCLSGFASLRLPSARCEELGWQNWAVVEWLGRPTPMHGVVGWWRRCGRHVYDGICQSLLRGGLGGRFVGSLRLVCRE
jgi:hypothetical protein